MDAFGTILFMLAGLWLFIPAFTPNVGAVLVGGGTPVDFGRSWKGKRILGDGKTWRGFIGGGLFGLLFGLLVMGAAFGADNLGIGDPSGIVMVDMFGYTGFWTGVCISLSLSFGALLGDMAGSFVKRRMGLERGQKAPILDQFDFLIGAFLLTAVFNWEWLYNTYLSMDEWHILALFLLLIVTLILHRAMNIIGYRMGKKKEPW